ncbi:DNA-directed RNA polymerase II subunit RPB1-like, partial [Penaeus japonicus]|uniref:DNA-directed RNA polymerase II subunit RPB1-like n=1 Tax=Penaeus japonicus TaxID=27405 RepID=UPI001C7166B0
FRQKSDGRKPSNQVVRQMADEKLSLEEESELSFEANMLTLESEEEDEMRVTRILFNIATAEPQYLRTHSPHIPGYPPHPCTNCPHIPGSPQYLRTHSPHIPGYPQYPRTHSPHIPGYVPVYRPHQGTTALTSASPQYLSSAPVYSLPSHSSPHCNLLPSHSSLRTRAPTRAPTALTFQAMHSTYPLPLTFQAPTRAPTPSSHSSPPHPHLQALYPRLHTCVPTVLTFQATYRAPTPLSPLPHIPGSHPLHSTVLTFQAPPAALHCPHIPASAPAPTLPLTLQPRTRVPTALTFQLPHPSPQTQGTHCPQDSSLRTRVPTALTFQAPLHVPTAPTFQPQYPSACTAPHIPASAPAPTAPSHSRLPTHVPTALTFQPQYPPSAPVLTAHIPAS